MERSIRSVYWEAPEHHHMEKSTDWYWILGIVAVSGAVASIIFGNVLFAVVILLGSVTMIIVSYKHPRLISFEVSVRGIRIHDDFHPFATLESHYIDEDHRHGPHLLVKSKKLFVPLLILPVPLDYLDEIENIIAPRLPEAHLEEPFAHHLLDALGF